MTDRIDNTLSAVIGATGGLVIEWDVIMISAVNAAIVGFVGALFGLIAKWFWNTVREKIGLKTKAEKEHENEIK